jgi:hypothetical protein
MHGVKWGDDRGGPQEWWLQSHLYATSRRYHFSKVSGVAEFQDPRAPGDRSHVPSSQANGILHR